ncbi:MAG: GGDEF domain-containing response regulator [Nitrospira sp.]|nr:GGDEF domain-containing response regulator [Nitrospira sp.]
MSLPLQLLILEDSPSDAELMIERLREAGFDPHARRVDTAQDYLSALDHMPDVILSDFSMPQFNAREAIRLMKEQGLDIPFIVVSGCIGEEIAVQCIKDGAVDYLLKDRLGRLAPAVTQALEHKRLQKEKRAVEERLFHESFHDSLTGLPNRALFIERLGQALTRSKRDPNHTFAVLMIHLNGFTAVKENLGPLSGDRLLIEAGRRLVRHVRSFDSVARLGGDEFVVLLDDLRDATNATRVATRLQQELASPFSADAHDVFLGATVGITVSTSGYEVADDMIRDAGAALYRAKTSETGGFVMYDATMHAHALARLKLETDLRRGLDRNEFRLFYQPIVSLDTGRIAGFEALLRWHHPEQGFVSPTAVIRVAEDTGLILPIGRWAIREACSRLQTWRHEYRHSPPLTMSVNLSGHQLKDTDLLPYVAQILKDTGLGQHALKIEVTESAMMENADGAALLLHNLRRHHIHTCIDDFGTGYSSLSSLQQLPIDFIKIDRSFVSRMHDDAKSLEIIHTIISLAHTLGAQVIAEGVETAEQLAKLRVWKCHYGQGYYFAEPLNTDDATTLLSKQLRW